MKGTDFLKSIGPVYSQDRQAKIVLAVEKGWSLPPLWESIPVRHPDGRVFTIQVMNDALMIGEVDDFVRVNVSHLDAQHIADILDCRLPTVKIVDLVHSHAVLTIEPCTSEPDAHMASTERMAKHSKAISDKAGISSCYTPFTCSVGKDWVLTNNYPHPLKGANYGWHTKSVPNSVHPEWGPFPCKIGGYVFQPLGFRHDIHHTDYSQTLRLVSKYVGVEDAANRKSSVVELDKVLTSPDTADLFSYEGVLKYTRHPGIPPM